MGNFSRDTFNRLNHYVSVRLQQGVPILDADWNEAQDIHKFELQAFLKWFVGNGVPLSSDGFAIGDAGADLDFAIADGRCLVEGWEVINDWAEQHTNGLQYTSQPLFGNTDLAAEWSVAELPVLTTPSSDRTDTVYLDVWEREVNSGEDDLLVHPDIGIETSVRTRREWVVRVVEGTVLPTPDAGHVHYPLATRHWTQVGPDPAVIDHVTDQRRTGLALQSQHDIQQIITDAFGSGYDLNGNSQSNLKVSLLEAVNALLAGSVPRSEPQWLTDRDNGLLDGVSAAFKDGQGDLWMIWLQINLEGQDTISFRYKRYDSALDIWTEELPLSTPTQDIENHLAFADFDDNVWLFWQSDEGSGPSNVWYRRYERASDTWVEATQRTFSTTEVESYHTFVDNGGDIWLLWCNDASTGTGEIRSMRYDRESKTWGSEELITSINTDNVRHVFAVQDKDDLVRLFWTSDSLGSRDIWHSTFNGTGWTAPERLTTDADYDEEPFAVADDAGDVSLFWKRGDNTFSMRYLSVFDEWSAETLLGGASDWNGGHRAVRSGDGDVWVTWIDELGINAKKYTAATGWGPTIQVSTNVESIALAPMPVVDGTDLLVFWTELFSSDVDFDYDIRYRRLMTAI